MLSIIVALAGKRDDRYPITVSQRKRTVGVRETGKGLRGSEAEYMMSILKPMGAGGYRVQAKRG